MRCARSVASNKAAKLRCRLTVREAARVVTDQIMKDINPFLNPTRKDK